MCSKLKITLSYFKKKKKSPLEECSHLLKLPLKITDKGVYLRNELYFYVQEVRGIVIKVGCL